MTSIHCANACVHVTPCGETAYRLTMIYWSSGWSPSASATSATRLSLTTHQSRSRPSASPGTVGPAELVSNQQQLILLLSASLGCAGVSTVRLQCRVQSAANAAHRGGGLRWMGNWGGGGGSLEELHLTFKDTALWLKNVPLWLRLWAVVYCVRIYAGILNLTCRPTCTIISYMYNCLTRIYFLLVANACIQLRDWRLPVSETSRQTKAGSSFRQFSFQFDEKSFNANVYSFRFRLITARQRKAINRWLFRTSAQHPL